MLEPLQREGMSSSSLCFYNLQEASRWQGWQQHGKTCEKTNCEAARRFSIILD